jgi:hypothetical protein
MSKQLLYVHRYTLCLGQLLLPLGRQPQAVTGTPSSTLQLMFLSWLILAVTAAAAADAAAFTQEHYTSPSRLAIEGRSAGGLLMGAVTNMRPDLFNAVLMGVPFVDVLTTSEQFGW